MNVLRTTQTSAIVSSHILVRQVFWQSYIWVLLSYFYTNYTRRGFGGRVPLNGTGVMSVILDMATPLPANARKADSRPRPTPRTTTDASFMPI